MNKNDFPTTDNMGDPLPPFEEVYFNWLTTKQATEVMELSHGGIMSACQRGKLRAVKIGSPRRGEWRIDPIAAKEFIKDTRGRK